LGSEAVAVKLNVFGLTDATLTLKINGAVVHSETISLSGFSTISIPISNPGPGAHTLEAVLTAGGLSSTKEISFLYGTNLSDIAADVWSSGTMIGKDGTMKLFATAGNRGKTIAIPTSMTLHDGDAMLATFPVGELAPGTSQSFEFLWNVIGKAGEHTLQAIVDPQNVHTEFTKDNNRVTRRIVIPDVALITETDKESHGMGEQVVINATSINLTAGTNYPNLTCTTIVRDSSGNEVFRQSKSLSLSPSQTGETTATWNTGGLAGEGKYTIRQEIATGATVIAERTKVITITAGSGFSLEVNPASVKVKQGETGHFTISVGAPSGWGGSVTLDAQGIPEGTTASFVPNIITGSGTSVVSVTTSATTPHGTYTLILRGQGSDGPGGTTQIIPITLDVAGFSLQAVPESISIIQQEAADFTIRATSLNDYTGALVLSDTNSRIGGLLLTIDNPNLSVPGGETVVRVQSSKYVPPGTYTIKLSGSDGILSRDVTLSVGVTQNPGIVPGFVVTPGPGFDNRALVTLLNRNFVEKVEFTAFKTRFGSNAVMGDIDGDGEDEVIVAPGPDPLADGRVKIFRQDGALLLEQPVLATKFGAYLTAGDIDGDWQEEVVVGAGPGLKNTARIKVLSFDGQGLSNTGINFVAFSTVYRLGVRVALGDVDGDGIMEIIAGAGPSPLSPARVKVFKVDTSDGTGSWSISSTHADFIVDFGDWYPYIFGVNVAAGDVDGDGKAEIIAGAGPNPLQKAIVAVYRGDGTFTGTRFEAYPSNEYRFGVNVTARDLDGDGVAEIITGPGPSPFSDSWIRVFRGDGTLLSDGFLAFPESTKFGAKVATGNTGE
ncbi:MAG: FG-GAP-like repeat-containing protein, partial [Syntrophorhabdus sp.]